MRTLLVTLIMCFSLWAHANEKDNYQIVVSKDGLGNFTTITDALESLPMYCYERVTIYIKNGVYNEKFKINCDFITLIGESTDSTIIQYNQLRTDWLSKPDDIGPAVINIFADDIILKNLTIKNTQPEIGPHAFAIYGTGTRTILLNCSVISKGGDTVSLWNFKTGMYYHSNCHFEGAVDFVCPRGWCYISNSTFFEVKETAAIWHAAPINKDQKFVLENCEFDGVKDFYLARHHYEAQFYLLNCTFSESMANKAIEHVCYPDKPEKNRPYFYGDRYYFFNCKRPAGNYDWFASNEKTWSVAPEKVTAAWTFDNQWNPELEENISAVKVEVTDSNVVIYFNELMGIEEDIILQSTSGNTYTYYQGGGRDIIEFKKTSGNKPLKKGDTLKVIQGGVYALKAYCATNLFKEVVVE